MDNVKLPRGRRRGEEECRTLLHQFFFHMKSSLEMTELDAAKLTAEPNDCSARFVLQIKEEWESGVLNDRNKKRAKVAVDI